MSIPTLTDLPDFAMNKILKKLDFRSIISLQKVCRHLRNFIDDVKPESHLKHVSISFHPNLIRLSLPYNSIENKYEKHNNGCLVNGRNGHIFKEKQLENCDYVEIFLNDFNLILRNQKSPIQTFYVYFETSSMDDNELLEHLKIHFCSWNYQIPVRNLSIGAENQAEIMTILPYLNPIFLHKMDLSKRKIDNFESDEIFQTDQWKNLKIVSFYNMVTTAPLQNFSHLISIAIFRNSFCGKDLEELREMFLTSQYMTTFLIHCKLIDTNQFIRILGQPRITPGISESSGYKWVLVAEKDRHLEFSVSESVENWQCLMEWAKPRNQFR